MADDAVDSRFVREGRPLRGWLTQLTDADPATRHAAENAVTAMWWNAPLADATVHEHLGPDPETHRAAWGRAISETLADPTFPGQAFVDTALDRMRAEARERDELFDLENKWLDPAPGEESERNPSALEEQVKAKYAQQNLGRLPNSFGGHTLHMVIEQAGPVLLSMPETVRAGLRDRATRQAMAKALEQLGPAAAAFAPDLLSLKDADTSEDAVADPTAGSLSSPAAIAAVGREDATTVRSLLAIATSTDPRAAYDARDALARIGPAAVGLVPSLVDELLAVAVSDPDRTATMLPCLAALAPGRRDVFDLAVDAARMRPPEMRQYETHPQYSYDAAMCRRGPAIEALGRFTPFADEAVAVLTDAIDTFEEYDPDWDYENAEHGRVIDALGRLGPAAAAVVPALIRHLRQRDGDLDRPIIRLLGRLGTAAAADALPALRQLRSELAAEYPEGYAVEDDAEPEEYDGLEWTIWHVQGKPSRGS
jgi:hypothetical protein